MNADAILAAIAALSPFERAELARAALPHAAMHQLLEEVDARYRALDPDTPALVAYCVGLIAAEKKLLREE